MFQGCRSSSKGAIQVCTWVAVSFVGVAEDGPVSGRVLPLLAVTAPPGTVGLRSSLSCLMLPGWLWVSCHKAPPIESLWYESWLPLEQTSKKAREGLQQRNHGVLQPVFKVTLSHSCCIYILWECHCVQSAFNGSGFLKYDYQEVEITVGHITRCTPHLFQDFL